MNVLKNNNFSNLVEFSKQAPILEKEQEFENLKNEVGDIKNMLTKIIEKLDG